MHISFLRVLLIIALCASSTVSYGQETATSQSLRQIPEPLFVINSVIIANGNVTQLDPKNFKETLVYKRLEGPGVLNNLAPGGIISITYAGQIESKSFAEIGRQYGVQGPLSVVLNGHKLSAEQVATLRIAPEAVGQVQVTRAPSGSSETIVAIQMSEMKPDKRKSAPGTIMIR